MKTPLIILLILLFSDFVNAQCVTNVDFNSWSKAGHPGNGNWVVQSGGSQVRQTINGENTYYISPFDLMNVRITGNFRSNDLDDDWMGFVFSFLNPMGAIDTFDMWLYDWKQDKQGSSPQGMSLCRVDGVIPSSQYGLTFGSHVNTPEFNVVQNTFGGSGWSWNTNHSFELRLTYTRATIYIDGNLIFDRQDCFKPGRFGFYNKSQKDCYYSNFQYDLFIDFFVNSDGKVCTGDSMAFQFVNPCFNSNLSQYQSLTWNFGDGSPSVVNNNPTFANANVHHVYQTPGIYTATLTVVDNNGCSATSTRTIDVKNPITLTPVLNQPPCNGGLNGSIGVTPTGGFGNYSYSWNGGASNQQLWSGVSAGTYSVSVTDGVCSATAQYTLDQPTPLTATTSHTDASCGQNDGTATIVISGGTPPYQNVSWAGIPGYTVTGLWPGTHIAHFTDFNTCSALLQYTETVTALPCGINLSSSNTSVTCFGGNNGTATVTVTGGSPPSNIAWSNGMSGATITGLAAGVYTYNYSDANPANNFSGNVTITQPGAALSAQLSTTGISCAGLNDGMALASVTSGGSPPYNYTWSGGQPNNPTASNLSPGPISVTITDASGCSATASGTVPGTPTLAVSIVTTIDSCYLSGKGRAVATATGGNAPYIYTWSNFYNGADNQNLKAGTYTVTVTDKNNCTVVESATITGPSAPLNYTYTKQDVLCKGAATGSIDISVTGGTPGYTFTWDSGGATGSNATGLVAGAYGFTITDDHGCFIFGTDTILEPDSALIVTSSHTDVLCHGADDGTLTVTISGGTLPYSYQGLPVPAGSNTLTGLAAGVYTGVVLDSNSCSVSVSDTINEPGPQSLTFTKTDNTCFGVAQGSATADFVNATGTVSYSWTGGLSGATINNLAAGTYSVTAVDQNNCTLTDSIEITEPAAIILGVTFADALCFGGNGTATATTPSAGTPPFNYSWSNGDTGQTVALPAGTYSATSTDAIGCQQISDPFTIGEPAQIALQALQTNVSCYGGNDGSIVLTVSGGASPYTYSWSPNVSTGNSATAIAAGSYSVTITDQGSCTIDTSFVITQPDSLQVIATPVNPLCSGESSGSVSVLATGGVAPYSYSITSDGVNFTTSASGQFTGLPAENYTVQVTDANSCTQSTQLTLTDPALISNNANVVDVSCFGDTNGQLTITATGGTPNFTYSLSNGDQNTTGIFSDLPVGNYTVEITDANNCTLMDSFSVNQPDAVSVFVVPDSATVKFDEKVVLQTSTNQSGSITYNWLPLTGLSCYNCEAPEFDGQNTTQYTVTVENENGCTGSQDVTLIVVLDHIVYIPNAFTPSDDGINDTWKIYGNINGVTDIKVSIFNRWGEKIFESFDPDFEWDGTYKGELQKPGVFLFTVNLLFRDGYRVKKNGTLTLVR